MKTLVSKSLRVTALMVLLGGACSRAASEEQENPYEVMSVFTRALQLIRQDYVDEGKVSYQDLAYSALRGMLSNLDPHSQFMEPDEFKGMQDETKSEFGGLGIELSWRDGNLSVVSAMEDSPAFKAGLLPADQILKINNKSTDGLDINQASRLLRGNAGEKVTLTVYRASTKELKDFTVERAIIKVESVKDAKWLSSELAGDYKIGYLRITQFNEPTAQELSKKLDQLQGMQALVLDLRYNPGGLLTSAVDVCAHFLPPNQMVVYTEGRLPSQKKIYRTPENGKERPYFPLAILINGSSASGAEIVAGALKDLKRAILVGETTFGKGSVQSVIRLPDDSAVRLTTARYYTPSKQLIHEHGITPNIRATLTPEQESQLLASRRDLLLPEKSQSKNFKDTQLERAVDALKGVMIYTQLRRPEQFSRSKNPATEVLR